MSDATDEQFTVLPVYVVLDTAVPADAVRELDQLPAMLDELFRQDPVLADVVQWGLVSMDIDGANVVRPLSEALADQMTPLRRGTGMPDLAAALTLLRGLIDADIDALRAEGLKCYRPVVFVILGGDPDPQWRRAFADLSQWDPETRQGFRAYPILVPLVWGTVPEWLPLELIHPPGVSRGYRSDDGVRPLLEVILHVIAGMTAGYSSSSQPHPTRLLPDAGSVPPGVTLISSRADVDQERPVGDQIGVDGGDTAGERGA